MTQAGGGIRLEHYLSAKGRARHGFDWPIIILLGFIIFGYLWVSDVREFMEDPLVYSMAYAVILAIHGVPVWLIIRRRLRQRDAKRFARLFAAQDESVVYVMTAEKPLRIREPVSRLKLLMDAGYMDNITLDEIRGIAVLTPPPPIVPPKWVIDVVCPRCGGTTTIESGTPGRCAWCDSLLPIAGSDPKTE